MNDVTINIFVLFAFFSLLHVSLGYIPKVGWLGQSVWTLLLLFLYVARLISRGVNTFWKCQIRQWGLEKWWLNWKSLACVVHQIPSSCLLPAPVTKKCVCVWGGGECLRRTSEPPPSVNPSASPRGASCFLSMRGFLSLERRLHSLTWVVTPVLPPPCWVPLDKSPNLSEPDSFPSCTWG